MSSSSPSTFLPTFSTTQRRRMPPDDLQSSETRARRDPVFSKRQLSGKVSLLPGPYVPHHYHTHDIRPNHSIPLNASQSLWCGFMAGCVTRTSVAPLDVVKILLQLRSKSCLEVSRGIYQLEGLAGFWKGNLAGCCRLAPYCSSKFYVYDSCKQHLGPNVALTNQHRLVFGATAGVVATIVSYPMELIRTILIAQSGHGREYHGVVDGLLKIYTREGLRGLYRGCPTALLGVMPFEGIQFAMYESLKEYAVVCRFPHWRWTCEEKRACSPVDILVIGSLSGMLAQTVTYPLDSIKKRLQAQAGHDPRLCHTVVQYRGIRDCFQQVVQQEGPGALFRGCLTNLIRIMPYSAIMFTSYEYFKQLALNVS